MATQLRRLISLMKSAYWTTLKYMEITYEDEDS